MPQQESYKKILEGLKEELGKSEFSDGIEFFIQDFPKNYEEFEAACLILKKEKLDLLYAITTPAAKAAKKCFSGIPIIFNAVGDPLGANIVDSLREPKGNITGFSNLSKELTGKRLEIFKEAFPHIKKVVTFYNPENTFSKLAIEDLRKASKLYDIKVVEIVGEDSDDVREKMLRLNKDKIDGVFLLPDTLALSMFNEILNFANSKKIPVMAHEAELVTRGAAISYGANFYELGRLSASYVIALLRGEGVDSYPVFFPDYFELAVNKRVISQLSLSLSNRILFLADKVIL